MIVICKEYPKRSRRKFVIYIAAKQVTYRVINNLSIRSRYNPELEYYVTQLDETADESHILAVAKQTLKEPYFTRI